jgi:phosphatidylinositol N-acetylglucosaminyltransferase subunit C
VIVQHVCSVAIFICCFAAIYQDRISPVSVVGLASIATFIGWSLWDYWMGQEEEYRAATAIELARRAYVEGLDDSSTTGSEGSFNPTMNGNGHILGKPAERGLGLSLSTSNLVMQSHDRKPSKPSKHSHSVSANSLQSLSPITPLHDSVSDAFPPLQPSPSRQSIAPPYSGSTLSPSLSPRVQSRLKTVKSALLIYFTLLGLSPILKSLTRSTSSDSIWALATWLLIINIFFFDYGGLYVPTKSSIPHNAVEKSLPNGSLTDGLARVATHGILGGAPPFPSSLSTNAALMASTVLASRLPSITHVFSLTVFSIEVFGLFPVFRRHLRHMSWNGHVLLTIFLVLASSAGMSIILSTSYTHTYGACGVCWSWIWHILRRSILGMLIGGLGTSLVMGGCSWWLISLQRYKNVVIGPWDPARPILADGSLIRGRGSSG